MKARASSHPLIGFAGHLATSLPILIQGANLLYQLFKRLMEKDPSLRVRIADRELCKAKLSMKVVECASQFLDGLSWRL
jgi:hypothetical protein